MKYELTILVKETTTLHEMRIFENLLNAIGKDVKQVELREHQRLAYKIDGEEYANYYYYEMDLNRASKEPQLIENLCELSKISLRYLLLELDKRLQDK